MDSYSLRLNQPYTALPGIPVIADRLPGVVESWEREANFWGPFSASLTINEGDGVTLRDLIDWHSLWLGYQPVETIGAEFWRGYIHEMRLYTGDVCRVTGYDVGRATEQEPGMFNAVRCGIGRLIENAEFEEDGAGPPVFEGWSQSIGAGDSITKETTDPIKGGQSPKLTNGGSGNTYLYQETAVVAQTEYELSFVSCGDGSVDGRFRVYDKSNEADIIPITATENAGRGEFRSVTEKFVTPTGCTSLRVYFYAPAAAGWAIFDSVTLRRVTDGDAGEDYTAWAVQQQSIDRHGRREITLSGDNLTPTQAASKRDEFLATHAWPQEVQEDGDGETRLEVICCGYIQMASWLYTGNTINGKTATLSAHVTAIAALLPWVTDTAVGVNTKTLTMPEAPQTLLSALQMVAEADPAWRIHVGNGRRLIYEAIDYTPTLYKSRGKVYRRLGDRETADPRQILPMSVVRDMDFPDTSRLPGSPMLQRRDTLYETVTVGPNGLRRRVARI